MRLVRGRGSARSGHRREGQLALSGFPRAAHRARAGGDASVPHDADDDVAHEDDDVELVRDDEGMTETMEVMTEIMEKKTEMMNKMAMQTPQT